MIQHLEGYPVEHVSSGIFLAHKMLSKLQIANFLVFFFLGRYAFCDKVLYHGVSAMIGVLWSCIKAAVSQVNFHIAVDKLNLMCFYLFFRLMGKESVKKIQ